MAVETFTVGGNFGCTQRAYLGMRAGVMVVVWMRGGFGADDAVVVSTAAITYTAGTVQRLAGLGLSVAHDQYVALPD
ncbi:hypothetical protein AB0J72_15260 [Dactylosporangium sp. NPDC049742]|uniref:hypothetical protein n=1 Tax=Dactylosporangium sp. NPDC049742 TaxID=3154737 RepID=UPI003436EFB5